MSARTLVLALLCFACDDDAGEEQPWQSGPKDAAGSVAPDGGAVDADPTPEPDATIIEDDAGASDDGVDAGAAAPAIEDLVIAANPSNVLARYVEWRTAEPVATRLEVQCRDAADEVDFDQIYATATLRTDHRVYVMGLYGGARCTVTAVSERDGRSVRAIKELEVEAPDFLPEPNVELVDIDRVHPGWTLVNIGNREARVSATAAYLDAFGRWRWYRQIPQANAGSDTEVAQAADGVLMCGLRGDYPTYVFDWEGNITWEHRYPSAHHDCRFIDPEETILRFLATSADCEDVASGSIIEYDRARQFTRWTWSFCQHFTPEDERRDWDHLNTIEPFPEGDLLISARNQHSLFKISRETGEVLWKFGLVSDFEMGEGTQFWRQHAPEIQPNGNIVLFDNGSRAERPYSRMIELAYDEEAGTVELVWEFVPAPRLFANIWGDADRLPNGNTLGTFGFRTEGDRTTLYEVNADAEAVWKVSFPEYWGIYRADRQAPPTYGYVIED